MPCPDLSWTFPRCLLVCSGPEENWTVHIAIPAQHTGDVIGSVQVIVTESGDVS